MNTTCVCYDLQSTMTTLRDCLSFTLVRERYLPYAVMHMKMRCSADLQPPVQIRFFLDSFMLIDGIVQKADISQEDGLTVLNATVRSFTAALSKNQLEPGIHSDVTLDSLMTVYDLPHISYQTGMQQVDYVFVKEHSPMWDALAAYNYKLNGGYPYVRADNLLCVTPQAQHAPVILPSELLARRSLCRNDSIVSRFLMADLSGDYGAFSADNPEAVPRQIVNVRQIPFDKQFLYDPAAGLQYRIALCNRRILGRAVAYIGYCGEDIEDAVTADGVTAFVSKITVRGDRKGIVTEDCFYTDRFCNAIAQNTGTACE